MKPLAILSTISRRVCADTLNPNKLKGHRARVCTYETVKWSQNSRCTCNIVYVQCIVIANVHNKTLLMSKHMYDIAFISSSIVMPLKIIIFFFFDTLLCLILEVLCKYL